MADTLAITSGDVCLVVHQVGISIWCPSHHRMGVRSVIIYLSEPHSHDCHCEKKINYVPKVIVRQRRRQSRFMIAQPSPNPFLLRTRSQLK